MGQSKKVEIARVDVSGVLAGYLILEDRYTARFLAADEFVKRKRRLTVTLSLQDPWNERETQRSLRASIAFGGTLPPFFPTCCRRARYEP